jgi:hypothetical protein
MLRNSLSQHSVTKGRYESPEKSNARKSSLTSSSSTHFPVISPGKPSSTKPTPQYYEYPPPDSVIQPFSSNNIHTRLSGLGDNSNTSGLYSSQIKPRNPLLICVRCNDLPSLCMNCVETECETALTFYRKTRAAGAATLFNKAFVEAGYSKVLKFLIFRLLKNSCQTRTRIRMKKKMIVEKLFGTNLVYLPFNAWKRFTKENIMNRNNKQIEELQEKVKFLEIQNQKLVMQNRDLNIEVSYIINIIIIIHKNIYVIISPLFLLNFFSFIENKNIYYIF